MGFNTSSIWIKVALCCLLLGTLLFVIGFATKSWMVRGYRYDDIDYGLWAGRHCDRRYCNHYDMTNKYELQSRGWTDWYRATQAFECIGLICQLLALLIILIFVFVDRMRKRSALIGIIVCCFISAVAMAIGFVIFGINMEAYSVGWSMVLAIIGCALTFVAGVMGIIDLKNHEIRIITR